MSKHMESRHIPCPLGSGCDFNGTQDEITGHEKNCNWRHVNCPTSTCEEKLPANEVLEHCAKQHGMAQHYGGTRMDLSLSSPFPIWIESCDGHFFLTLHERDKTFYIWIYTTADEDWAKALWVKLSLGEGAHTMDWELKPIPLDYSRQHICSKSEEAVALPMVMAKRMRREINNVWSMPISCSFRNSFSAGAFFCRDL